MPTRRVRSTPPQVPRDLRAEAEASAGDRSAGARVGQARAEHDRGRPGRRSVTPGAARVHQPDAQEGDRMTITPQQVVNALIYDPNSGSFQWRRSTTTGGCVQPGRACGSISESGYLRIRIAGRLYMAHRIVWAYVHGRWPTDQIDHINGNRSDNRLCNLREASRSLNMQNQRRAQSKNRSSGLLGVSWRKDRSRWQASIRLDGRLEHLGYFISPEDAHAEYVSAKRRLHEGCTI